MGSVQGLMKRRGTNAFLNRDCFSIVPTAVLCLGMFFGIGIANAADREQIPAETRIYPYAANIPECDSSWTVTRIQSLFAANEQHYWNSSLAIDRIERIRTQSFRPLGLDLIPRRFCEAVAVLSNNERRTLAYVIIEDAGLVGNSHDVHWCVDGYDRNWSYAPACRLARP